MSGLTIDFEKRGDWFNFHFSGKLLTADFCIEHPYDRTKEEWTELRDAIETNTHYPLTFKGCENFTYIETDGSGTLTFYSGETGGLSVDIGINLDTNRLVVLDVFDHVLENYM